MLAVRSHASCVRVRNDQEPLPPPLSLFLSVRSIRRLRRAIATQRYWQTAQTQTRRRSRFEVEVLQPLQPPQPRFPIHLPGRTLKTETGGMRV